MEKIKTPLEWYESEEQNEYATSGIIYPPDEGMRRYGQYCYEQGVRNALGMAAEKAVIIYKIRDFKLGEDNYTEIKTPHVDKDSILSLEQQLTPKTETK